MLKVGAYFRLPSLCWFTGKDKDCRIQFNTFFGRTVIEKQKPLGNEYGLKWGVVDGGGGWNGGVGPNLSPWVVFAFFLVQNIFSNLKIIFFEKNIFDHMYIYFTIYLYFQIENIYMSVFFFLTKYRVFQHTFSRLIYLLKLIHV